MNRFGSSLRTTARAGFSLVELMIAMGIFAVGAIAVASIFPVAILLQKATVENVNARAYADSAFALVTARGFNESYLLTPAPTLNEVFADAQAVEEWSRLDRLYNATLLPASRRVAWTALFMPTDLTAGAEEWLVLIFVMRRQADGVYNKGGTAADWASDFTDNTMPSVTWLTPSSAGGQVIAFDNDPRLVRIGDVVVDDSGRDWRVTGASDTQITVDGQIPAGSISRIWYVHPGNTGSSAFVRLIKASSTAYPTLIRP